MASLTVGAFASAAVAHGRSHALIFVDVRAAYDSTNKRLALPTADAGEWIRRSVLEMGFTDLESVEIADEGLRTLEWGGAPAYLPHRLSLLSCLCFSPAAPDEHPR